jgi:glycerophosphoryl diester phosphodiesterase
MSARAELWPLAEAVDEPLLAAAEALNSPNVALAANAFDAASAIRLREVGLGVVVWTVNDPDEARRMRDLGVRALCTDEPAAIRTALAQS